MQNASRPVIPVVSVFAMMGTKATVQNVSKKKIPAKNAARMPNAPYEGNTQGRDAPAIRDLRVTDSCAKQSILVPNAHAKRIVCGESVFARKKVESFFYRRIIILIIL